MTSKRLPPSVLHAQKRALARVLTVWFPTWPPTRIQKAIIEARKAARGTDYFAILSLPNSEPDEARFQSSHDFPNP